LSLILSLVYLPDSTATPGVRAEADEAAGQQRSPFCLATEPNFSTADTSENDGFLPTTSGTSSFHHQGR
jgi:hypothetical protein